MKNKKEQEPLDPELEKVIHNLEIKDFDPKPEEIHQDMAFQVNHMVEISEALVHSIPESYYLAFSEIELKAIYDWSKSLLSAEEFFAASEKYQDYAYLIFDSKANTIHEHFLYKDTLLDRANFVKKLQELYRSEEESENPSISNKLKILGMIQIERANMDRALAEYRKYMRKTEEDDKDNLKKIVKNVIRKRGILE